MSRRLENLVLALLFAGVALACGEQSGKERLGPTSSTLAISEITATETPDPNAEKRLTLRIGIRKQSNSAVDPNKVKVLVQFYDSVDDKDVRLTDADVNYEWVTPSHDWVRTNPEVLAVTYFRPKKDQAIKQGDLAAGSRRYLGYVVRIYYKDKLQTDRAAPDNLLSLFPSAPVSTPLFAEGYEALSRGDYSSALEAFQKAADQGDATSLGNLGYLYEAGKGVPQDYGKAIELYQQAAAKGCIPAEVSLAAMYVAGRGVPRDYKKAALFLEKPVTQGDARAQTALGSLYENGFGVETDLGRAVSLYQQAAERGYVHAQVKLADMYSEGRGVNKDSKKAAELYQKAADQGDPNAETNLGWMYDEGKGVPQDYRKAVELYQKAADQGYPPGQAYLASLYTEGKGVSRDYRKAVDLFQKAVKQGPFPNVFNDYAWFLATCPKASLRNGKDAVNYANKACQLSGWKEANFIGTLAAAFAELGDFDAAVRYQKQAMATAADYPDKRTTEKALKLYQERKPYRE